MEHNPQFELSFLVLFYNKQSRFKRIILIAAWFLGILYFSLPGFQIPLLEFYPVKISSLMEQRAIENRNLLPPLISSASFSAINPLLFKGIIGMEDGNFFLHRGIDWDALQESMRKNQRSKKIKRGGSTVSMQLSKNLFFTTDRSFFRKAKEMLTTMRMEKEISKRAILTQYVNIIEWGKNIYGISDAADEYFSVEPSGLKTEQVARLVAVIPGPLVYQPNKNSRYVQRRSTIVRGRFETPLYFDNDQPKKTSRTGRRR